MKWRLALTVVFVFLLGGKASMADYSFASWYEADDGTALRGTKLEFCAVDGATAAYDGVDAERLVLPSPAGSQVYAAIHKVDGEDGWDHTTGFYDSDFRAPLLPGQTVVFDGIYVWADMSVPPQNLRLYFIGTPYLPPPLTYKLTLVSIPEGVEYNGLREWGPDHGDIILPFYSSDDGTTGYQFRAEVTAIPEPSPLLALASGLSGLVVWRRRKAG